MFDLVYAGAEVPADLTAEMFTNEFLDPKHRTLRCEGVWHPALYDLNP